MPRGKVERMNTKLQYVLYTGDYDIMDATIKRLGYTVSLEPKCIFRAVGVGDSVIFQCFSPHAHFGEEVSLDTCTSCAMRQPDKTARLPHGDPETKSEASEPSSPQSQ